MTPFILEGDVLTVVPPRSVQRGDVVLVCPEERGCLAHRVLRDTGEQVVLQGDRNWHPDGAYPLDSVLGQVIAAERGKRTIQLDRGPYRALGSLWTYLQPLRRTIWRIRHALLGHRRE